MNRQRLMVGSIVIIALALYVVGVSREYRNAFASDDGRVDTYADGFRVGSTDGTKINSLTVGTITFAGGTSGTMNISQMGASDDYFIVGGFDDPSGDYEEIDYDVEEGQVRATTGAATTGTLKVLVIGY